MRATNVRRPARRIFVTAALMVEIPQCQPQRLRHSQPNGVAVLEGIP